MQLDSWDDIRVALAVARTGTVSGAAAILGVHHATVIRRIDALESQLGARLFQRHPRGYALTEAGRTLLTVAGGADESFAQMAARISGAGERIEGELVVTSLPDVTPRVMPPLIALLAAHPALRLRYLTDARLFRLDVGEAHVAIRGGPRPTEPDYVVRQMGPVRPRFYASSAYLAAHGPVGRGRAPNARADAAPADGAALDPTHPDLTHPDLTAADLTGHRFALPGPEARGAPFMRWLLDRITDDAVILVSNDETARSAIVRAGLAIAQLPPEAADGLVEVMAQPEWDAPLWMVTHVDLHRTPKVQAALAALATLRQP